MELRSLIADHFKLVEDSDKWQAVNCPFHSDKNKSAGITLEGKGAFNCFAQCLGDESHMGLKRLADKLGLDSNNLNGVVHTNGSYIVTKNNIFDVATGQVIDTSIKVPIKVKEQPINQQVGEIVDFLEEKKLSMKTITDNRGYFCSDVTNEYYGYLVFVLHDGTKVGRRIIQNEALPRFKNDEGIKSLLGAQNIKAGENIILCEGVSDYLTLWELGYRNIVCSMGSALSKQQAFYLRECTVFIIYDRDFSGYEGAKAAKKLLKEEYNANGIIIELPDIFGDSRVSKIDVSSAYIKADRGFYLWLLEKLARYEQTDVGYIQRIKERPKLTYYPTGVGGIDLALNGGMTQGLYGFAGKPKEGKSTLLHTFARSFVRQSRRVLLYTYELSIDQVWARYASTYSRHSWVNIERDPSILEPHVLEILERDSNYLKIASDPTQEEIIERSKRYDIVMFDYLQRMPSTEKDPNTAIRVNNKMLSEMSMGGKTVILVSSMARDVYEAEGKIGIFKGSGDIEYTMQAGVKISKVGSNRVHLDFVANTRGNLWQGFCNVDWEHQRITGETQ